jgi:hypothetical protein
MGEYSLADELFVRRLMPICNSRTCTRVAGILSSRHDMREKKKRKKINE